MNRLILITKPSFDTTTFYLSYYADKISFYLDSVGIKHTSFSNTNVTKMNVHKFLLKQSPSFLFLNGHGSDSEIEGHKNNIIFSTNDFNLFSSQIIYARSCLLGKFFGKNVFKNKDGCFIGYKNAFTFFIDNNHSNAPDKDKLAELFLEPSNDVALSIIKGNSALESHKRGKNAMLKNMKKLLSKPNSMPLLEALWNNYEGQVIFGNKQKSF